MWNILSQFFFIPSAPLTEKNCPDQTGRVFIVTGGYTGVGLELCKILFAHHATVWVAGRSESKAHKAISSIKNASPQSNGKIEFLHLDLSDLSTIKPAVNSFTAKQQRLDVLMNNAGIMNPPKGSISTQGHELQIGTNCLGHYLLYQLLLPLLTQTAASSPTGTVRVAWASSITVQVDSSPPGIIVNDDGSPIDQGVSRNYSQSKVGNVFMAREFAKSTPQTGVVHVAFNPGNLRTELLRHSTGLQSWFLNTFIVHPAIYGAYTELWTALTPELTPDKSGAYVYPWGRLGSLPAGIETSMSAESGISADFVGWCDRQTEAFA